MKYTVFSFLIILISVSFAAAEVAESGPGTSTTEQTTQTISLQPGWNSVSFKVSGLSFTEDIKPQCSFNWYNQDLADGASVEDISEQNRHYVWTQQGGSWSHPDEIKVSRGYSLNVNSECEFEVSGERTRIDTFELEDGWNLVNMPSGLAFGQVKKECKLKWYSQELASSSPSEISEDNRHYYWVNDGGEWRDPHKESDHREDDGVYVNSDGSCKISSWPYDGDTSDDSDSDTEDTEAECDSGYEWSSWIGECVEVNERIEESLNQIEDTEWDVVTEDNTIHTLDDLSLESNNNDHRLMIHTGYKDGELADHGQTGWCGDVYFETDSLSGVNTFTINMEKLENTKYGAEQKTQTPYIQVGDDTVFEEGSNYIPPGESEVVTADVEVDETVRVGIEDRDLGCGQYARRTKAIIDIYPRPTGP